MNKAWLYVVTGGLLEILWILCLKLSNGLSVPIYTAIAVTFAALSFYLFSKGMQLLPAGIAYTVFTGIGAAGAIIFGIICLNEQVTFSKILFTTLLLTGIIRLKAQTGGAH